MTLENQSKSIKKNETGIFIKPINLEYRSIGIKGHLRSLIKNTLKRLKKIKKGLKRLKKKSHKNFKCILIHRKSWAEDVFKDMQKNKIFYQKFSKPNNLAITTAHNYKTKSLFEKSLDHLGIDNYVCLNHPEVTEWYHPYKLIWLLEFLKSGNCKEDLILMCDAADSIFINDPKKIIDIFSKYKCELLFMSTTMPRGYPTKESRIWAKHFNGTSYQHLNSGIYIGRKNFLLKFLEEFLSIVRKIQLEKHPIWKSLRDYYQDKNIDAYSRKSFQYDLKIADQNIFRFMHPKYPQVKIDIYNELAIRNRMNIITYLKYFINKFIYNE